MHWTIEEVPWGNLFRTAVTTYLFFLVIGFPIAIASDLDEGPGFVLAAGTVAFVLASIVVWSDRVPWIGD